MSSYERTFWRDEWMSGRHREWGRNVPCVDLDCVVTEKGEKMEGTGWSVCEYDHKTPVALVEYKARGAKVNLQDANNITLRKLADMSGLPFFVVCYDKEKLRFGVVPVNEQAKCLCPEKIIYNEPQYVEFLHRIRGRQATGAQ